MVSEVTIPLQWANQTPGVSGIDDVSFEIPETEDITQAIDRTLPDEDDIRQIIDEALQEIDPEDLITVDLGQLDVGDLSADAVADAVLDRLEITPGLFGPLEDPLDEVIERAVRQALGALDELDVDLGALEGEELLEVPNRLGDLRVDIRDLQEAVSRLRRLSEERSIPTADELATALEEPLQAAVEEALPDLLTQPIEETARDLTERILDNLVDDETAEALRQEAEDIQL